MQKRNVVSAVKFTVFVCTYHIYYTPIKKEFLTTIEDFTDNNANGIYLKDLDAVTCTAQYNHISLN